MNYNNRGNQQIYGTGCSLFGCLIALLIFGFIVRGSIFFFFRYFWLIIVLGVVIWVFRKFIHSNNDNSNSSNNQQGRRRQDWHRDFENRRDTGYDNFDRDFEEVDEDEDNQDDEFSDF